MDIATGLVFYLTSFIAIWFGAGLIIQSVDKIAHKLKLSSFAVSFFVLGLLTSIPEAAVSINAVIEHKPEVFVGTFLGGVIVIFLLIIPILAILGKGLKLNHDLSSTSLIGLLVVIALPGLMILDHKVTNLEGFILILAYAIIFYFIERKHGVFEHRRTKPLSVKMYSFLDLAKVALGIGIVFVSSQFIVNQTMVFSQLLNVPAFYLSLVVLAVGTNLPELSLAIRAVLSGRKDIAFGDYLGSAAANTLLFGVFTIVNDGEVFTFNSFLITFLFIITGLILFYFFSQSKKDISRKEGIILMAVYGLFVVYEISRGLFF